MTAASGLVDLHVHTTASDGSLSPREVVRAAREAGVVTLAVTDHDTVAGLPEAIQAAKDDSLDLLTGLEISVDWPGTTMHILAYGFRPDDPALLRTLERFRDFRRDRNVRLLARLAELGMPLEWDAVAAHAGGETVSRMHVARAMVDAGYVASSEAAFRRWLARGSPGYVERQRATPQEAIAIIRNAGGLAVLAHPRQMQRPFAEIRAIVEQLVGWGLEGMEVIHPDHSADDVRMFGLMAERQGLIVTGGTDFHGHLRHGVQLGVGHGRLRVPPECVAQIRQRLAAR